MWEDQQSLTTGISHVLGTVVERGFQGRAVEKGESHLTGVVSEEGIWGVSALVCNKSWFRAGVPGPQERGDRHQWGHFLDHRWD